MESRKSKVNQELITKLWSAYDSTVIQTLQQLRHAGHCEYLPDILQLLNETKSEQVQKEISQLLCDLKDSNGIPYILEALQNEKFGKIKHIIVSACWQSSLNYADHLGIFIDIFLKEDYITALEAFSVIEESAIHLTEYELDQYRDELSYGLEEVDEIKKPLVRELINILQ